MGLSPPDRLSQRQLRSVFMWTAEESCRLPSCSGADIALYIVSAVCLY